MIFNLWPPVRQSISVDVKTGIISQDFFRWLNNLFVLLQGTLAQGFTGTITLAKLTGGGANGSMTFVNGVVVAQVPPT